MISERYESYNKKCFYYVDKMFVVHVCKRYIPINFYLFNIYQDMVKRSHPPSFRGKKKISCPMCKKEYHLPRDGVSGFPHDFRIQSMLDRQNAKNVDSPSGILKITVPSLTREDILT